MEEEEGDRFSEATIMVSDVGLEGAEDRPWHFLHHHLLPRLDLHHHHLLLLRLALLLVLVGRNGVKY